MWCSMTISFIGAAVHLLWAIFIAINVIPHARTAFQTGRLYKYPPKNS